MGLVELRPVGLPLLTLRPFEDDLVAQRLDVDCYRRLRWGLTRLPPYQQAERFLRLVPHDDFPSYGTSALPLLPKQMGNMPPEIVPNMGFGSPLQQPYSTAEALPQRAARL